MTADRETFIGEPIQPKLGSFDTAAMATGGPGLPRLFAWRGNEYKVAVVLKTWRTREPGVGMDSDYTYVRKHFYRVKTTAGDVMTLYFDRKPLGGRGKHKIRWFLFSIAQAVPPDER